MNLNKTIDLLGSLQSVLAVLAQLPASHRAFVRETLRCNGIDPDLLARQAVKCKHQLQDSVATERALVVQGQPEAPDRARQLAEAG